MSAIFGIDLGTSNAALSVNGNNKVRILDLGRGINKYVENGADSRYVQPASQWNT